MILLINQVIRSACSIPDQAYTLQCGSMALKHTKTILIRDDVQHVLVILNMLMHQLLNNIFIIIRLFYF